MRDGNDVLMGSGGKSASFPTIGTEITGFILTQPEARQQIDLATDQPKVYKDGNPMMQVVVVMSTDQRDPEDSQDDGVRRLWLKANMLKAVREAVRAAGATRLEVGGKLMVRHTAVGGVAKPGFNPPKLYEARYWPPSNLGDTTGVGGVITLPTHGSAGHALMRPDGVDPADWAIMTPEQRARVVSAYNA